MEKEKEECLEKIKAENSNLRQKISELSSEIENLRTEKYSVESGLRKMERENEKLFSIVENLSKGYANFERGSVK